MTRTAFIGDIHGYAPALEMALERCLAEHVDTIVGLGDVIDGYNGDEECIHLVREHFSACVRGNHDEDHGMNCVPTLTDGSTNCQSQLNLKDGWSLIALLVATVQTNTFDPQLTHGTASTIANLIVALLGIPINRCSIDSVIPMHLIQKRWMPQEKGRFLKTGADIYWSILHWHTTEADSKIPDFRFSKAILRD